MRKLEVLNAEIGNGTIIKFVSKENININDKVSITYQDKEHYFDIKSIKTTNSDDYLDNNLLYVEAVETGFISRNYFNKMKDFDLRSILELKITIIKDEEKLKNIKK